MDIYKAHRALTEMNKFRREANDALRVDNVLMTSIVPNEIAVSEVLLAVMANYYDVKYFYGEDVVTCPDLRQGCKSDYVSNFNPEDVHRAFMEIYGGCIWNTRLQIAANRAWEVYCKLSDSERAKKKDIVVFKIPNFKADETYPNILEHALVVNALEMLLNVLTHGFLPPPHSTSGIQTLTQNMFYPYLWGKIRTLKNHPFFHSTRIYKNGKMIIALKDKTLIKRLESELLFGVDSMDYELKNPPVIVKSLREKVRTGRLVSI